MESKSLDLSSSNLKIWTPLSPLNLNMMPIQTILVVDDDYFMRTSLQGYLTSQGYAVITASHAAEALSQLEQKPPDVAVIDIVIPIDGSRERGDLKQSVGLQLVRQLKERRPDIGVVILSAHEDRRDEVLELFRTMNGIIYQIKGSRSPTVLLQAIRMAARGDIWIDPDANLTRVSTYLLNLSSPTERPILEQALIRLPQLTPRQREVLAKVGEACSNKRMAEELHIVEGTIVTHINTIYATLFNQAAKEANLRESVLLAKVALIDRARRLEQR